MLLNTNRATRIMEENNVDALVATLPENVYYFTGFAGWGCRAYKEWQQVPGGSNFRRQSYAVLTREDKANPTLIAPVHNANYTAQHPEWIELEDVYTFGSSSFEFRPGINLKRLEVLRYKAIIEATDRNSPNSGQALVKVLKERGLEKSKIGIDMENLNPSAHEALIQNLPRADIRNACELIRLIRMVKSPAEIERLRMASKVNENARKVFLAHIKLGITEKELLQVYIESVTEQGGVYEFFNCPAGSRSGGMFPPSDYRIRKGDMMWYDFGCIVNHYHCDLGNTVVLGKPTKEQTALYEGCVSGMQALLDMIQPGVKPSEVAVPGNEALKKHGLQPHASGFLHGVGLEIRDYPLHVASLNPTGLSDGFLKPRSNDMPLEENMVINLEVSHMIFGFGAAQIEHSLLVTKSGYELICPQPRELYMAPV